MTTVQEVIQSAQQAALDAVAEQAAAVERAVRAVKPPLDINEFLVDSITKDAEVEALVRRRVGQPVFLADGYVQETFVITNEVFAAKSVLLSQLPAIADQTTVFVIRGTEQLYNVDFTLVERKLTWAGLALEQLLDLGDVINVRYFT